MGPQSNEKCSCKREAEGGLTDGSRGSPVSREAEVGMMWSQTKNAHSHQRLKEVKHGLPSGASRGNVAMLGP